MNKEQLLETLKDYVEAIKDALRISDRIPSVDLKEVGLYAVVSAGELEMFKFRGLLEDAIFDLEKE